ncbi:hypothetical protein [Bosea thiooxidans]
MHFASSGDPVLDRRYGRAKAALEDGDPQAAVEILDQTVAQAYHFTAAWHLYGAADHDRDPHRRHLRRQACTRQIQAAMPPRRSC